MMYNYLILALVFSLIVLNVIPAYADGTTMYYREHAYDSFHSSISFKRNGILVIMLDLHLEMLIKANLPCSYLYQLLQLMDMIISFRLDEGTAGQW